MGLTAASGPGAPSTPRGRTRTGLRVANNQVHGADGPPVERAIDRSEGKKSGTTPSREAKRAPAPSSGTTGGSIGNIREGYAANQATNLADAC